MGFKALFPPLPPSLGYLDLAVAALTGPEAKKRGTGL